ncbi:MAG: iron permease FTR1, partial [Candidatus Afipia apatlaquensis]|nr:iron permease FTR1 [Candidatus Afipia apatlaquensis]
EQSLLPVTELKSFGWLQSLGLNSTLEAVSAQLLVIFFALATFSIVQRNARLAREDKAKAIETAKT